MPKNKEIHKRESIKSNKSNKSLKSLKSFGEDSSLTDPTSSDSDKETDETFENNDIEKELVMIRTLYPDYYAYKNMEKE